MVVTLALGGCRSGAAARDRDAPDAGGGGDGAQTDSSGSPSLDAAADAGPVAADPVGDFHVLLADINDAFYGNYATCFGTRRGLWPSGDFTDLPVASLDGSLRLGLLALDPAAAQHCVETLMTASCERLIEIAMRGPLGPGNSALPECAGVLVGQVPRGKTCRINQDCQDPVQNACIGNGICGRVCTARSERAAGDTCSEGRDRCAEGTVCRYGPNNANEQRCLAPTPEGTACREDRECAAGLMCAERTATSVFDGTCKPFALGSACAGNWECAHGYVCAGAGPDRAGTCQVGKPVGAACATYLKGVNNNIYSDCAVGTKCVDLDGNGPRCSDGAPLGAPCGPQPDPDSDWLGCIEGACDRGPGNRLTVGTCQPTRPAGSACSSRTDCTAPNQCLRERDGSLRCGLPNQAAPLGSACTVGIDDCGNGAYCALPATADPESPVVTSTGSCARQIPVGQACREHVDLCEGLAECVGGVCTGC